MSIQLLKRQSTALQATAMLACNTHPVKVTTTNVPAHDQLLGLSSFVTVVKGMRQPSMLGLQQIRSSNPHLLAYPLVSPTYHRQQASKAPPSALVKQVLCAHQQQPGNNRQPTWSKQFAEQLQLTESMLPATITVNAWLRANRACLAPSKQPLYQTLSQAMTLLAQQCHPTTAIQSLPSSQQQQMVMLQMYLNAYFPQAYLLAIMLPAIVAYHRQTHLAIRQGVHPALLQALRNTAAKMPMATPKLGCLQLLLPIKLTNSLALTSSAFNSTLVSIAPSVTIAIAVLSIVWVYGPSMALLMKQLLNQLPQEYRRIATADRHYRALYAQLQLHKLCQQHQPLGPQSLPSYQPRPRPLSISMPRQLYPFQPQKLSSRQLQLQQWTTAATRQLLSQNARQVLRLQYHLESKILGQATAIERISAAIQRNYFNNRDQASPLGAFVLLGPPGVGKNSTATILAKRLYGGADKLLTINMRHYRAPGALKQLLGGSSNRLPTDTPSGQLTSFLHWHPQAVVLFKHIEAAHNSAWQEITKGIANGYLTTEHGKPISLRHCLILMSSELQAPVPSSAKLEHSLDSITFWQEQLLRQPCQQLEVIGYHHLQPKSIAAIVEQLLQGYNHRLMRKGFQLSLSKRCQHDIIHHVYNHAHGVPSLQRFVETELANLLLTQQVPLQGHFYIDKLANGSFHCSLVSHPSPSRSRPAGTMDFV